MLYILVSTYYNINLTTVLNAWRNEVTTRVYMTYAYSYILLGGQGYHQVFFGILKVIQISIL